MAAVTVASIKEYLGITVTTYDTLLGNLLTRMHSFVESYCERVIEKANYTEQHDGTLENGGLLILNVFPVISLTSLYDDLEREFKDGTLIAAADYVIYKDEGTIQLDNEKQFKEGLQNIKAVYEAGYTTYPADLEQALIELVARKFQRRGSEGVKSEKLGRWSATYGEIPMTAGIMEVLDRYRIRKAYVI